MEEAEALVGLGLDADDRVLGEGAKSMISVDVTIKWTWSIHTRVSETGQSFGSQANIRVIH